MKYDFNLLMGANGTAFENNWPLASVTDNSAILSAKLTRTLQ